VQKETFQRRGKKRCEKKKGLQGREFPEGEGVVKGRRKRSMRKLTLLQNPKEKEKDIKNTKQVVTHYL